MLVGGVQVQRGPWSPPAPPALLHPHASGDLAFSVETKDRSRPALS